MPSKNTREVLRSSVARELEAVDLGDRRRDVRASVVASKLAANPRTSFPDLVKDSAELEAMYRLFSNENVAHEAILKPHIEATARRCATAGTVFAVHDMTEFTFGGARAGLTEAGLNSTFYAHLTLSVAPASEHSVAMPLGLLGLHPFLTNRGSKGRLDRGKGARKDSRAARYKTPRAEKESFIWDIGALTSVEAAGPDVQLIHVVDQECDDYAFLSLLIEDELRFIVRGSPTRLAWDSERSRAVREVVLETKCRVTRTIEVSPRLQADPAHPKRQGRQAIVEVRACPVMFRAVKGAQASLTQLTLNVVHILEANPPTGEPPVEWLLFTSEPIETPEQLQFIVDGYCARWLIEEFFKSLKTGCAFEERQLESGRALLNVLALCIPIAWRMLVLRTGARSVFGKEGASLVLSEQQIALLRILRPKLKLPLRPSLRDALLAIASLGGHLKNNGDPGWLTLWRGYRELLQAQLLADALRDAEQVKEM